VAWIRPRWCSTDTRDDPSNASSSRRPTTEMRRRLSRRAADHPPDQERPGCGSSTLTPQRRHTASMVKSGPSPCHWSSTTVATQKPRRPVLLRIDGAGTEKRPNINEADASVGGVIPVWSPASDDLDDILINPIVKRPPEIFSRHDPRTKAGYTVRSTLPPRTLINKASVCGAGISEIRGHSALVEAIRARSSEVSVRRVWSCSPARRGTY
jgi:hypothetical protein